MYYNSKEKNESINFVVAFSSDKRLAKWFYFCETELVLHCTNYTVQAVGSDWEAAGLQWI